DVVLLIGTDELARFWLNGQLILDAPRYTPPDSYALGVTLQPGRNTLLAKVVNTIRGHGFELRISDRPQDLARMDHDQHRWEKAAAASALAFAREPSNPQPAFHEAWGHALVELGRWKEAVGVFERVHALDPENLLIRNHLLRTYLAENDLASY